MYKYNLVIAMRIYPGISKTPYFYSSSKIQLVELVLKSMFLAVAGLSTKYYFILDNCPIAYETLINTIFSKDDFEIVHTNKIGNLATFGKQLDILSTQTDAPYIYFAEDDYLYAPNAINSLVSFMQNNKKAHFVTCYDHVDYYNHPIHSYKKKYISYNSMLYKKVHSTCLTFLTTKTTLQKSIEIFRTYCKGNNDCAVWLTVTKKHIYNPFMYLKFKLIHKESYGILKMAVKYGFKNFFHIKTYQLWVPEPGTGTHLEKGLLSPCIDWETVKQTVEKKFKPE
jgi:hypothetical protein